jgi:hypothetical protein
MQHFAPIGTLAAAYNAPSGPAFNGGNISYGSLYEAVQAMASYSASSAPTAGGTLTINGVAIGNYDFCVKQGSQTISAFTATDWFTGTQDTRSAFVVVNGSLTINAGITVIPTVRKLFVVVYCTGNLTLNGTISMSLRGANHSGTGSSGGATTAGAVRIATGTFSGVSNPTIAAAGAAGGTGVATNWTNGNAGQSAGTTLATGGGGGGGKGAHNSTNNAWGSGAGASGTAFSGGAGGGAFADFFQSATGPAGAGGSSGGAGGAGAGGGEGGVGNPSPARVGGSADSGTGGVLVVISAASVSGTGALVANGGSQTSSSASPAPNSGVCGGASGGGLVCLMGRSISGPTLMASGGTAAATGFSPISGGSGGSGFASQLIIP